MSQKYSKDTLVEDFKHKEKKSSSKLSSPDYQKR
jgi:hypothetical protein